MFVIFYSDTHMFYVLNVLQSTHVLQLYVFGTYVCMYAMHVFKLYIMSSPRESKKYFSSARFELATLVSLSPRLNLAVASSGFRFPVRRHQT